MEKLLDFYFNLNLTKTIEEQILQDIKKLHDPWVIKEEIEIEKPTEQNFNSKQNEAIPNIEGFKEIDEILNRAKKIYSKAMVSVEKEEVKQEIQAKPQSAPPVEPIVKPLKEENGVKKPTVTKTGLVPAAKKTPSVKPVYMNAPYKTQAPIPKPSRPISALSTNRSVANKKTISKEKSNDISQENEYDDEVLCKKQEDEKHEVAVLVSKRDNGFVYNPLTQSYVSPPSGDKLIYQNEFSFTIKQSGRELRLIPNLEDLLMKNFKFKQSLYKIIKQMNYFSSQAKPLSNNSGKKGSIELATLANNEKSFMQKLESSNYLNQNCPSYTHLAIQKLQFIYAKASCFIEKEINVIYMIDDRELRFIKLNFLIQKLSLFEQKLNEQFNTLRKQVLNYYKNNKPQQKDLSLLEEKIFFIDGNRRVNFKTLSEDNLVENYDFINFMPISYKNGKDLKQFHELKCNLIELKFESIILDLLDEYMEQFRSLKEFNDKATIEQFNLIYQLITNKMSVIVKE